MKIVPADFSNFQNIIKFILNIQDFGIKIGIICIKIINLSEIYNFKGLQKNQKHKKAKKNSY